MKYSIKVNEVRAKEGSNIKGFATVVFGDSFKITNIAILENKDKGELFVSMPRYRSNERDASIDKLDNLAMNVQLDKEKHMENAKTKEQTEPERAEAERVEAEVVYSPMVAEPQEYQYNADAFEARGVDEVKQEAAHKEAPKVREDKAR